MAQQVDIIANLLMKVDGAEAGIKKVQSSLSRLKMPNDFNQKFTKSFSNLEGIITRFKNQLNSGFNTKGDVSNITKIAKEMDVELSRISKDFKEVTGQTIDFKVNSSELIAAGKKLEELIAKREEIAKKSISLSIKTESGKTGDVTELLKNIQKEAGNTKAGQYAKEALNAFQTSNITAYTAAVEKLEKAYSNLRSEAKKTADIGNGITMGEGIKAITTHAEGASRATRQLDKEIEDTKNDIASIQTSQIEKANKVFLDASANVDKLGSELSQTGAAAKDFANSTYSMNKQLGDLQQSTQYFFSLRNMINLLRQGVDQAIESIKNLDKAMTETAVVTDFNVADMWKDLPKYTKLANELGATTQGAYETMTLYYQQGLDQQATFEIGAETMKMARIAGLDYAKTTDMMTAALRGFNMELSEVSAQRIDDVYSELAARTASNTQEIGEAMERTASIAHSAGMSFEGTAAFLAQMIETTREAPENLGTAMKTIVARFQELKKNPLEISEVDGEAVDFNKIDTALKTIGVDLVATNGQFRNLDEVFLDISKKWGSLTQMQQRYIATVAAGSRQQSRFIAMVGNYDRTMELMEYANESAGASQEQFNKTLDSFEAKMNKLQNAWQQFTMSIANNTFVKGAVDGVTLVLDTVNELINTLSGGNGVVKSFLSLFTAFTGLKVAGRVINGLIGGLGGMLDPATKGGFGAGARAGALGANANRITNPIISKLSEILTAVNNIKNKGTKGSNQKQANYEDRKLGLKGLAKGGKIDARKAREQFKGLSQEDQLRLFQSNRGSMNAIRRSAYTMIDNAFKDNPKMQTLGKTIQTDIFKGMSEGQIKPAVGLKALGNPSSWGAIAGTDAAKGFSTSYQAEVKRLNTQAADYAYKMLNIGLNDRNGEGLKRLGKQEAFLDLFKSKFKELKQEQFGAALGQLPDEIPLTGMDRLANAASGVGGAFADAGQSISSFGALLTQLGGPFSLVGSGLQTVGGLVSNFGMTIGGVGSAISGLQAAATAMKVSMSALVGPIAAVTAGIAAIGIIATVVKKHNDDIKKSAKEVADAYDKTTKRIEKNRTTLKNYQGEWERLSQGVDSNGMNVSLEQADYDKYQEMVQKIADINPDIIEGFNAQGKAIITNNKALSETLQLLEQQEKEARKTYTSDKSFRDVIAARDINKDYYKQLRVPKPATSGYWIGGGDGYGTTATKANAPMQGAVQSIANSLDSKDFDININKILSRYNIKLEQLKAGEEKAVKTFVKNQDSISAEIQAAASETGEKASEYYADNLEKGFTSLSKDTAKFNKAIQPTINLLAARLTDSKAYQNIAPEMRSALMSGLEGIAAQDKGYKDIISDAESFATKLGDITAEGSDYSIAMEGAAEAQEHFADTLDVGEYVRETADEIEKLENLKSKYEDSNEAYAQALTEHLNNQIEKIKNFTKEGVVSLSEALNWIAPQIQSAEKALENFQEATKSDYSTAAEGMKSIFDEIFKETELENGEKAQLHLQGRGDKTFQTGAISLLGREQVADVYKNKEGVEAEKDLEKRLKRLQPMLQEGADGAEAFWNKLLNLDKKKIPKGVEINKELESLTIEPNNQEAFHQLAVELGMSDDLLASMLSKLQQFGEVSFSNIGDVRKALAVDEGVVNGLGGDQKKLYVRREHLESAMSEAGYSFDQMAREERNLEKKGNIVVIDEPVKLDNRTLSDMGITDMASAIQVLGDTGQYTKEEIFAVAEKFGATQAGFNSAYGDYTKVSQDPSISNIQSIEGTVQDIYSLLASRLVREGELNESNKQSSEIDKQVKSDLVSNFAKGLDTEGNFLSLEKYQSTYDELTKFKDTTQDYLDNLKAGLKVAEAEGDEEKIAEYKEEIDKVKNSLSLLDSQLVEASNAFLVLANEAREIQSTKAEVNQKVNEYNKEHKNEGLKKAYNADGFDGKNKLNTEALSTLISKAQAAFDDRGTQREVIGQYIQNQSKQLVDNNATNEQIATAISDAAAQMKEQGFKPQEITDAINQGFGTHFQSGDFDYKTGELNPEVDISNLQEQLKNLQAKVTLNVDQINLGTSARGRNNPNSAFRRTGTMARGSKKGYTISGRPTLMGEEGEEIVWEPKRNEAYIVGSKGPQFGNISKDAVVWNSKQTKKIKKNSGSISRLGTGSRGINQIGTMAKGNKGGGGGSASINGRLNLDAAANIKEVVPPEKLAEVPVKAKLQVQGAEKGGIVNKIKSLLGGGKNNGPTVNAAVNVTQFKVGEEKKVNAIANITKLTSNTKETIDATAKITSAIKTGTVKGEPVKVKAQAVVSTVAKTDNKAENEIKEVGKKAGGTQTMTVGAETGPATTKINALVNKINHLKPKLHYGVEGPTDVNVDIWPHFKGSWNKTYTLNPKKLAKGQHNTIHSSIPQFGSAAKGYGTVGPKGRGGLTLTGEEGFEIAWLPSENRSMVLGANGPQMLNLPANAVVYTHKQSKKIIGQKSIPAGSLVSATKMDFGNNRNVGGGSGGKSTASGTTATSKSGGDKEAKKTSKETKKAVKTFTRWVTKAGAVSVWWENIARVMDDAQRKAEKTQTQLKKLLDGFGTTLETYKKTQEQYVNQQQRVLETAAKELEKVNQEIDTIANGTAKQQKANVALDKAEAQQDAAKKTKSKKDDKKAARAVKRAKKDVKTANRTAAKNETGSAVQVSWEVKQQKKKKKNGKWKTKKKKTKKQIVDLSKFIYEDENGVLQIDQAELDKIANSKRKNQGKEKAEAIKDAAEKEINDRIAKRNAAEDDAEKAQEALEQMYNDAYAAFNQWDKSITKLYLLGLEVEKLGNLRSAFESVADLEFAKLEAGFSSIIESVPKVKDALKHNVDNLVATAQLNTEKAKAAMEEFEAFLNPKNNFENFMKYGAGSPEALKDFQAINEALKAVGEAGFVNGKFDYNAAYDKLNELYASGQNAETYNKLKDGIDKIAEKQNEAINATAEAYQSQTEIYEKIEEYQSLISDFEDSLISGIEEQANKEIDQLSKINSSLTNAAKDLIDEVKRKLDERRKQEDNAKTESDISRKQQRLAMLRADTAGGHAVEIAQLEKEIADAQQSYGRTLEDQLLDKLQQQNDEAAKQRERQIELLEAQRDLAEALGTNVAEVNMWLQDPKKYEEQIKAAWMANQDFESKGIYTQAQINEEWNKTWANILAVMSYQDENGEKQIGILEHLLGFVQGSGLSTEYLETGSALENLEKTTSDILKTLNEGIKLNTVGLDLTPQTYKNYGYNAAQTMSMLTALGMKPSFEAMSGAYSLEELISSGIYDIEDFTEQGYNLERIVKDLVDKKMLRSEILALIKNSFGKEQRALAVNILKKMGITTNEQYATGGLATRTGPAWLDGTPTKPELVLNAQDTKNFIALKDVLSHAVNSAGSTSQENAVYDIDINVDHINSDYDVDKIAKRVQNIIVEKSSYRNVTQVRSFR